MSIEAIKSLPPLTTTCFLIAAGIAARNVVPAICCKIGSVALNCIGKTSAASWRKSSNDYWAQARKDVVRDVAIVAGLILVGANAAASAEELEHLEQSSEKNEERLDRKEKPIKQLKKQETFEQKIDTIENSEKPEEIPDALSISAVKWCGNGVYTIGSYIIPPVLSNFYGLGAWGFRTGFDWASYLTIGGVKITVKTFVVIKDLGWQNQNYIIDGAAGMGLNWVRKKYFGGDGLRNYFHYSNTERTFSNGEVVKKWFFYGRPLVDGNYHRNHNPKYQVA